MPEQTISQGVAFTINISFGPQEEGHRHPDPPRRRQADNSTGNPDPHNEETPPAPKGHLDPEGPPKPDTDQSTTTVYTRTPPGPEPGHPRTKPASPPGGGAVREPHKSAAAAPPPARLTDAESIPDRREHQGKDGPDTPTPQSPRPYPNGPTPSPYGPQPYEGLPCCDCCCRRRVHAEHDRESRF